MAAEKVTKSLAIFSLVALIAFASSLLALPHEPKCPPRTYPLVTDIAGYAWLASAIILTFIRGFSDE